MEKTKSRFINLQHTGKPLCENGVPKEGQDFTVIYNKFGYTKLGVILNFKNGFLNSEPGIPAVQFEDTHTEYWQNGKLHREEYDSDGNLKPAVISDFGEHKEYWLNGIRQY